MIGTENREPLGTQREGAAFPQTGSMSPLGFCSLCDFLLPSDYYVFSAPYLIANNISRRSDKNTQSNAIEHLGFLD